MMLGTYLFYVGAALIINGYCGLAGVDEKSSAVMKLFAGVLGVIIQTFHLFWSNMAAVRIEQVSDVANMIETPAFQWYAAGTGLLIAFSFLWQAAIGIWRLDSRPYGVYCAFVAINAVFCAWLSYINFDGDWRFTIIWLAWAVLWIESTFEINFKMNGLAKFGSTLSILVGIFTAWVPGMMMMTGLWDSVLG